MSDSVTHGNIQRAVQEGIELMFIERIGGHRPVEPVTTAIGIVVHTCSGTSGRVPASVVAL